MTKGMQTIFITAFHSGLAHLDLVLVARSAFDGVIGIDQLTRCALPRILPTVRTRLPRHNSSGVTVSMGEERFCQRALLKAQQKGAKHPTKSV